MKGLRFTPFPRGSRPFLAWAEGRTRKPPKLLPVLLFCFFRLDLRPRITLMVKVFCPSVLWLHSAGKTLILPLPGLSWKLGGGAAASLPLERHGRRRGSLSPRAGGHGWGLERLRGRAAPRLCSFLPRGASRGTGATKGLFSAGSVPALAGRPRGELLVAGSREAGTLDLPPSLGYSCS